MEHFGFDFQTCNANTQAALLPEDSNPDEGLVVAEDQPYDEAEEGKKCQDLPAEEENPPHGPPRTTVTG